MKKIGSLLFIIMILIASSIPAFARHGEDNQHNCAHVIQSEISGYVYLDRNGNDVFDDDDPPLQGIVVLLKVYDAQTSTTTDENGYYMFTARTSTSYTLSIDLSSVWYGYELVAESDGVADNYIEVLTGFPCEENNFGFWFDSD